jgi:signal peptidase II
MRAVKRLFLIMLVLFSCVGCDQITKNIVRQSLANSGPISFLDNIFRLQYTENPGAFLSIGAGSSENMRFWVFIIFIGIFLVGMLVYLMASSNNSKPQTIALSLVVGGCISNLVDRIFNDGRVIDFMNVGIGSLRTGIFNIADIAITFGVLWIIAISIKEKKKQVL